MEKTPYLVSIDMDGHFALFDIKARKEILEFLKEDFEDGDAWANLFSEKSNAPSDEEIFSMTDEKWIEFIGEFVERGRLELKTVGE